MKGESVRGESVRGESTSCNLRLCSVSTQHVIVTRLVIVCHGECSESVFYLEVDWLMQALFGVRTSKCV